MSFFHLNIKNFFLNNLYMITVISSYGNIFHLYATWHASMFESFCGILQPGRVIFGKFDGVAHCPKEFIIACQ